MKKIKFSVLALLLAVCTAFSAQAKTGFSFGPKAGVTFNKLSSSGEKLFHADNRAGFTGGLTAEYIAPILGIGADISLMYAHQKSNIDGENISGNFFEIPIHVKYKLGLPAIESIVSPYIYTGPSVAFKLSGEDSYAGTKKTQWGWDLGLGVELIKHLQIGAGYTFGINKLVNHVYTDANAGHEIKIKNNYWTLTAAWMF
ncbi:MAG: PorT family protein [Bacteroides sp.]|nr:PorT family protein [Bacteroidales bacterium]MBD5302064.1 PorT family protein [Bacteroides sp.]